MAKTNPVKGAPKRFQPDDELLTLMVAVLIYQEGPVRSCAKAAVSPFDVIGQSLAG